MSNQCYRAKKIVEMITRNHKKAGSSDNGIVRQLSPTKSTACPPNTFVNELIAMPAVASNPSLAASAEPNPRDEQIPDSIIETYEHNAAATFDINQDLSEPCQGNEYLSLQLTAELYQTDEAPTVYRDQSETSQGAGEEIEDQILLQEENNMNVPNIEPQSSITDNTREVSVDKKCKKRIREPEKWKKNKKKCLKNAGRAYETVSGKLVPGKAVKPPCGDKCRLRCTENINEDQRLSIFTSFWKMGDLSRQRDYVYRCMEPFKPKYSLHNENSKRCLNIAYYFTVDSKKIRVCKRFYSATLDIGHSFLTTVSKKADSTGVISGDLRGKHAINGRRLPEAVKDGVRDHINSYPKKESHYCRASTSKTYLDGDLNLCMMYRQYKDWCVHNDKLLATQGTYENIFRTEFNISFYKPKKDMCSLCLSYTNANGEDKLNIEDAYLTHLREKELCRLDKEADIESCKNDSSKIICCYDMQAILQTPSGNDSLFFYKRRLNVYNCTVYEIVSKTGHCYLWNESLGGKGCDEVGTCILRFLKDYCIGKHVIFYTDNCSAQNKNKYLMSLYHYSIKVLGVLSITHKYLIVGHTQNEGDSVHSTIEQEKKRILKNGSIFVPSQWSSLIQCAKKKGNPYQVYELDYKDIVDLKELVSQFGKNFTINTDGDRVIWNDIKKIFMQASSPYSIFYCDTYGTSTMKCINVRHKMRGTAVNVELQIKKKYYARPKISNLKKKDLLALCNSVIPRVYWDFYTNLEATDNFVENEEN
ncbi:uncharacterized protein LOC121739498 isoform X3 [Aricia agestis]|uniref:uncharacterized protein LOC121735892 isoform X3 n=1 Tax=Aricia agestis TaxID=91739 RepID=UPI001C208833|nr:uncharacterized protein LOC121735892 isoform X3 [Aricia agestis]XP_041987920.1 uncharacterized protein LOC121739498 isoform X3 [Aricia agestis]